VMATGFTAHITVDPAKKVRSILSDWRNICLFMFVIV